MQIRPEAGRRIRGEGRYLGDLLPTLYLTSASPAAAPIEAAEWGGFVYPATLAVGYQNDGERRQPLAVIIPGQDRIPQRTANRVEPKRANSAVCANRPPCGAPAR